jgi:hypothetical protein
VEAVSGGLTDGIPSPHQVSAAWWTARVLSMGSTERAQLHASYLTVPTGGAVRAEDMLSAERLLVDVGLASEKADALVPNEELVLLARLDYDAFCQGFMGALLVAVPPVWLVGAASTGRVREELVPARAMAALAESLPEDWIRRRFLTVAASAARRERQAEIGLLGEQAVLEAVAGLLAQAGRADLALRISQVSLLTNSYGYDIWTPTPVEHSLHLEVKTCAARSPYHVHLTRYEADVAEHDGDWRLVVCTVEPGDVLVVVGLCDWGTLRDCIPVDPQVCCKWESAELTIAADKLSPIASMFGGR